MFPSNDEVSEAEHRRIAKVWLLKGLDIADDAPSGQLDHVRGYSYAALAKDERSEEQLDADMAMMTAGMD